MRGAQNVWLPEERRTHFKGKDPLAKRGRQGAGPRRGQVQGIKKEGPGEEGSGASENAGREGVVVMLFVGAVK